MICKQIKYLTLFVSIIFSSFRCSSISVPEKNSVENLKKARDIMLDVVRLQSESNKTEIKTEEQINNLKDAFQIFPRKTDKLLTTIDILVAASQREIDGNNKLIEKLSEVSK